MLQGRDELGMWLTEVSAHGASRGFATSLGVSFEGQHSPTKETGFGFFVPFPVSYSGNADVLVAACGPGPNLARLVSTS